MHAVAEINGLKDPPPQVPEPYHSVPKSTVCVDATASSGSISSSQARYGILGLPRSFSTHTTASMKHSSKKKSKKGRAGRGSGLKEHKRAVGDAESAGGNISGDWTLGSVPSQGDLFLTNNENYKQCMPVCDLC